MDTWNNMSEYQKRYAKSKKSDTVKVHPVLFHLQ